MQPRQSLDRPAWNSSGGWDAYKHMNGYPVQGNKFYTKPCNQIGKELKRGNK